jgi:hypothetical protein
LLIYSFVCSSILLFAHLFFLFAQGHGFVEFAAKRGADAAIALSGTRSDALDKKKFQVKLSSFPGAARSVVEQRERGAGEAAREAAKEKEKEEEKAPASLFRPRAVRRARGGAPPPGARKPPPKRRAPARPATAAATASKAQTNDELRRR